MTVSTALRLNMTGLCDDPKVESKRYRAAIEMAAFADQHGFSVVSVEEHHCAENGWLPSPLILAAMIAARTERIAVNVTALLIPLYDPIKLAEDIAVLDLASGGRFSFVAGMGYRPLEFAALDKDWDERGRRMDHVLETLFKAWSGEPFEYNGATIRVTPTPLTRPHPPFAIGGMTKARGPARCALRPSLLSADGAARARKRLSRGARPPRAQGHRRLSRRGQLDDLRRRGSRARLGGARALLPA